MRVCRDSHWHVFVSVHTWMMNTAEHSTEHSLAQNNLLHWDGQQNLQPWAYSCPETALPVLSPGQSISAEFGASSRGRKRARKSSSTRHKTRKGVLEWKDEKTKRNYNKTQTEPQTIRTFSPLRHGCKNLATWTHHYTSGCSWFPVLWKGSTAIYKRSLRDHRRVDPRVSSGCHQCSSAAGKALFLPPCSASSQVLLCAHTGTSESHCIQSWGTDRSEIKFSWLFFTWTQLPIGFTEHSHECLYWNIVVKNWR